jgi:hypothetical protein
LAPERILAEQRQFLRTYLNDHLRRAASAAELARRTGAATRGPISGHLAALATEFNDDRRDLLTLMASLDVRVEHVGLLVEWLSAKGRLLFRRRAKHKALGPLLEIEELQADVQRKLAVWDVLQAYLESRRPQGHRIERLIVKGRRQLARLAELHAQATAQMLRTRLTVADRAGRRRRVVAGTENALRR